MPSQSEKSFGAILRKFQDAVQYTKSWSNFQPPRPEESIVELTALIDSLLAANNTETSALVHYSAAVITRQELFTKEAGSVDKLLVPIRGAVEAQFGKKSAPAKSVVALIITMRSSRLIKLPADPGKPAAQETLSRSQQSYGSKTKMFTDIVTTLSETKGYTTSNPMLTLESLHNKVQALHNASNNLATSVQLISSARSTRTAGYEELKERVRRLKSYTKSQYGIASAEYKSLIALGI